MEHKLRLSGKSRIKKRGDYIKTQNQGKKAHTTNLVVACRKTSAKNAPTSRLGVTVSKRVNKRAVVRNLLKRRIKEVFRTSLPEIADGYDVVIIVRQSATQIGFQELKGELLRALRKLKLLGTTHAASI